LFLGYTLQSSIYVTTATALYAGTLNLKSQTVNIISSAGVTMLQATTDFMKLYHNSQIILQTSYLKLTALTGGTVTNFQFFTGTNSTVPSGTISSTAGNATQNNGDMDIKAGNVGIYCNETKQITCSPTYISINNGLEVSIGTGSDPNAQQFLCDNYVTSIYNPTEITISTRAGAVEEIKCTPTTTSIYNDERVLIGDYSSIGPYYWDSTSTLTSIYNAVLVEIQTVTMNLKTLASSGTFSLNFYTNKTNTNQRTGSIVTSGGTVTDGATMSITANTVNITGKSSTSSTVNAISLPDTSYKFINPVGTIIMFAGQTAPSGYTFCNGASNATTGTYANLFAIIGYTYGGSGGTFRVPNLCDKFPKGITTPSNLTNALVGTTTGGSYTILSTNLPDHTHPFDFDLYYQSNDFGNGGGGTRARVDNISTTSKPSGSGIANYAITFSNTSSTQSDSATNGQPYYQPFTLVNYIIKY
jgi:microcystin-dependent protein